MPVRNVVLADPFTAFRIANTAFAPLRELLFRCPHRSIGFASYTQLVTTYVTCLARFVSNSELQKLRSTSENDPNFSPGVIADIPLEIVDDIDRTLLLSALGRVPRQRPMLQNVLGNSLEHFERHAPRLRRRREAAEPAFLQPKQLSDLLSALPVLSMHSLRGDSSTLRITRAESEDYEGPSGGVQDESEYNDGDGDVVQEEVLRKWGAPSYRSFEDANLSRTGVGSRKGRSPRQRRQWARRLVLCGHLSTSSFLDLYSVPPFSITAGSAITALSAEAVSSHQLLSTLRGYVQGEKESVLPHVGGRRGTLLVPFSALHVMQRQYSESFDLHRGASDACGVLQLFTAALRRIEMDTGLIDPSRGPRFRTSAPAIVVIPPSVEFAFLLNYKRYSCFGLGMGEMQKPYEALLASLLASETIRSALVVKGLASELTSIHPLLRTVLQGPGGTAGRHEHYPQLNARVLLGDDGDAGGGAAQILQAAARVFTGVTVDDSLLESGGVDFSNAQTGVGIEASSGGGATAVESEEAGLSDYLKDRGERKLRNEMSTGFGRMATRVKKESERLAKTQGGGISRLVVVGGSSQSA